MRASIGEWHCRARAAPYAPAGPFFLPDLRSACLAGGFPLLRGRFFLNFASAPINRATAVKTPPAQRFLFLFFLSVCLSDSPRLASPRIFIPVSPISQSPPSFKKTIPKKNTNHLPCQPIHHRTMSFCLFFFDKPSRRAPFGVRFSRPKQKGGF